MIVSFRLTYSVRDLSIPPDVVHNFEYGGPHSLSVRLRAPSAEEQQAGYDPSTAFCMSFLRLQAGEKNERVFDDIAANRVLSSDANDWEVGASYIGPYGSRIRILGLTGFPEHFRTFVGGVHRELADHARRTVAVLRWRANQCGPHSPIGAIDWSWSADENFWHPAPTITSVVGDFFAPGVVTPEVLHDVRNRVASGATEPLGHEMLREADEQKWANPRSAVVIGVAAAEIGIKRCIAGLVPHAEWLVLNLPTPPLVQILTEYLPRLPARNKFGDVVKPPPADVLKAIKKGVHLRNQLAHAGTGKPTTEDVTEILRAVRDLLWLLDYYMGNDWALAYLRHETRAALMA